MTPPSTARQHPALPLGLRLGFIFLGITILLWLPVEDRSVIMVLLIAGAGCIMGALAVLNSLKQRRARAGDEDAARRKTLWYPLGGLLAGAAVTLVALALMAFKTGIHGHGAPDYTPEQVSLVLQLAPIWICVGLILGVLATAWRR